MNDNFEQLNNRLQQYYSKQTLPPDVILDLEEMINQTEVIDRTEVINQTGVINQIEAVFAPLWRWIPVRMVPKVSMASTALILLLSIVATTFLAYQQFGSQKIESVAAEIALNHAKQFDSEFFVTSIPNLSRSMELLDFAPVAPRKMQLMNYVVTGARYCTIDSAIAVQVRLEDENKLNYTLYEFRDMGSLEIKGEQVITVDNIQVTLWQEGNVTMGLARYIDEF